MSKTTKSFENYLWMQSLLFLPTGKFNNQGPSLCSHRTKDFVFLRISSKISLIPTVKFVLLESSTMLSESCRCLSSPSLYTLSPVCTQTPTLSQLLTSGWRRLDGTSSWVQQQGWHPKSELWGDARHSLPSGSELATSSWKDLLLNDIKLEWNTDHLSAVNDDIYLLTSQDQHY